MGAGAKQNTTIAQVDDTLPNSVMLKPGGRYLVTGGGTGGHVYPAIAIADEIKRRDKTAIFQYVGVRGRSEEVIVPKRGYDLKFVTSTGWPGGRNPFKLGKFAILLGLGLLKSLVIVMTFRPGLIIGTGGYVSAPIMMAAIVLRKLKLTKARTFIHEQNTFPGRLNRLVGRLVDCVGVSYPETLKYFPKTGRYVGYPVRKEVGEVDRVQARKALGITAEKRVVFAFGGSLGARTINRAMVDSLAILHKREDIHVIHGTGSYKGPGYNAIKDTESRLQGLNIAPEKLSYYPESYFHNIEQIYAAADLIVCRAGAGTLTEICAKGLPALVLPKAGLPGDHQVKNARSLASRGAAEVLYERVDPSTPGDLEEIHGSDLAKRIIELLDSPERLQQLGKRATACYISDALGNIAGTLATLQAKKALPAQGKVELREGPDLEAMTGAGLVSFLTRRFVIGQPPPVSEYDQEYLMYRTDRYLASSNWKVRNHGVKLVGLLNFQRRRSLLIEMVTDRTPVSGLPRYLGGDYHNVGFIRRNIFTALKRLNTVDDELVSALTSGLADPYFEAQSEAAACANFYGDRFESGRSQIEALLLKGALDSNFEVKVACCRALGSVARETNLVDAFRSLFFDPHWKVRQSIAQALEGQLKRGLLTPEEIRLAMDKLLITSNGFVPQFPLKAAVRSLGERLSELEAEQGGNAQ